MQRKKEKSEKGERQNNKLIGKDDAGLEKMLYICTR
jgi:hypothetical protein